MPATRPAIGVTIGDPGGIGPEVVVKALADPAVASLGAFRVFGDAGALERAARAAGVAFPAGDGVEVVACGGDGGGVFEARASERGGAASLAYLEGAVCAARAAPGAPGRVDAIVTGPISKEAWSLAGVGFPGHTEFLARRFDAPRVAMLFHAPASRGYGAFNVVLATGHVALSRVPEQLTERRVYDAISLGCEGVRRLGVRGPRVAVLGLNPHAGENGLLGDEERRVIGPAIARAAAAGVKVGGPFPADTLYGRAIGGEFDLVVAMYHDQGLIPVKLLAWDCAVNITVGLPVVRTSPDHGTAFDIAGRGAADAGSMKSAIRVAAKMAGVEGRSAAEAGPGADG